MRRGKCRSGLTTKLKHAGLGAWIASETLSGVACSAWLEANVNNTKTMNEVTIIAKFTTGTTQDNPKQAEASIRKLLLEGLAKHNFAQQHDHSGPTGLFGVEIISVKSESL